MSMITYAPVLTKAAILFTKLCKFFKFTGPETSQVASSHQYLPASSNNLQGGGGGGSSGPGSSSSSIARSVSFMSKSRVNAYDNYAPIGWRTGRNSVESTPTTSRKLVQSQASSMNGSSSTKQSPPGKI